MSDTSALLVVVFCKSLAMMTVSRRLASDSMLSILECVVNTHEAPRSAMLNSA